MFQKQRSYNKGFSLLQMTVIVTMLALLMANGAVFGQKYLDKRRFKITDARMQFVENAIISYASRYGYFPCPSGLTETLGDIYSGSETYHTSRASSQTDCSHSGIFASSDSDFYMGGVPWQELNLPYEYALDGWGRKIIYTMPKTFYEVMTSVSYDAEPQEHTGLVYWFDAANLSSYTLADSVSMNYYGEANGTKLNQLADSNDSGTIYLGASATSGGDQPIFTIQDNSGNKFPTIRFDGVDDELEILGHSYSTSQSELTLFVTARYTSSDAAGETLISYDDVTYYELGFEDYATDKLDFYSTSTAGSNALDGPDITDYNDGVFHHFIIAFQDSATPQIKFWANDTLEASDSPHEVDLSIGSGTRHGFVGVQGAASSSPATSTATGYFTGDISEIIVYNSRLSDLEVDDVFTYLDNKWSNNLINTEGPFLTINDIDDSELEDEAVFTLISTGPSGEGGYTKDGSALTDPDEEETEYNNIPISSFPTTQYAISARGSDNYRQRYSSSNFDDIVRYVPFSVIKEYKDNRRVN